MSRAGPCLRPGRSARLGEVASARRTALQVCRPPPVLARAGTGARGATPPCCPASLLGAPSNDHPCLQRAPPSLCTGLAGGTCAPAQRCGRHAPRGRSSAPSLPLHSPRPPPASLGLPRPPAHSFALCPSSPHPPPVPLPLASPNPRQPERWRSSRASARPSRLPIAGQRTSHALGCKPRHLITSLPRGCGGVAIPCVTHACENIK